MSNTPNPQTTPKDEGNQERLIGEAIKMANLTLSWLEESPKRVAVGGGDPGVSIFLYFYLLFLPLDLRDCVCVCVSGVCGTKQIMARE